MMEIYADTMLRMITFFDILPKQTRSPSGREQISVTQKISTVIPIPLISWCNITLKLMLFLLYSKEKRVQNVPSVLSVFYFLFLWITLLLLLHPLQSLLLQRHLLPHPGKAYLLLRTVQPVCQSRQLRKVS